MKKIKVGDSIEQKHTTLPVSTMLETLDSLPAKKGANILVFKLYHEIPLKEEEKKLVEKQTIERERQCAEITEKGPDSKELTEEALELLRKVVESDTELYESEAEITEEESKFLNTTLDSIREKIDRQEKLDTSELGYFFFFRINYPKDILEESVNITKKGENQELAQALYKGDYGAIEKNQLERVFFRHNAALEILMRKKGDNKKSAKLTQEAVVLRHRSREYLKKQPITKERWQKYQTRILESLNLIKRSIEQTEMIPKSEIKFRAHFAAIQKNQKGGAPRLQDLARLMGVSSTRIQQYETHIRSRLSSLSQKDLHAEK